MSENWFYFKLGWEHIIGVDALDHQLFILALTILFTLNEWKKVLILVTAFTIGHSITLALSALNIISIPDSITEFLIPCTIAITAASNILKPEVSPRSININYFFALFFGLIHGLGFANSIRFILADDQNFAWSLFSFNIGLEAGQLLVVIVILIFIHFLVRYLNFNRRYLIIIASAIILIISMIIAFKRFSC